MTIILLPVYNEEENIGKLLERFEALKFFKNGLKIVLVNDGSKDRSKDVIETFALRLPILLVNHPVNKGVTEAIKTGLNEVSKFLKDDDLVITMDSDNTHDPASIINVMDKFDEGYDIINGSRYCKGGSMVGVPLYRLFFSYSCKFLLTRVFPIDGILDYSIFYRGYRGRLIRKAIELYGDNLFQTKGFVGIPELLIKMSRLGGRTIEIPLVVRYDIKLGGSKMKVANTVKHYLDMIWLLKRQKL
ncbi:MAG: glycosyltransferase family 2 protein [Candidatus Omnitrophota bacterium]